MKTSLLALTVSLASLFAPELSADTLIGTFTFGSGHWDTVPNGGFETGDLSQWTPMFWSPATFQASGSAPIVGGYSAQITYDYPFDAPGIALATSVSVSLEGGQSYVLSGFIRRSSGSTAAMSLDLNDVPFEIQPYSVGGTDATQFVWGVFTPPADTSVTVRFVLDGDTTGGDMGTVDEIAITPLARFAPPALAVPELPAASLVAGGLLLGLAVWRRR
jgi:hypothetical protein